MTGKAFPGVGNLTFSWVWREKLNRKCQVSIFFFPAPKSLTAKNIFLGETKELRGYPKNLIDGTLSEVNFSGRQWVLRKEKKRLTRE